MPEQSDLTLWRAFVPKWAFDPLSGQGASVYGGRWNPVGAPTLYAACELSTAWAEYNQGFVQHPALIAQMTLKNAALADLTAESVRAEEGISPEIHRCEWRHHLDHGEVPETHAVRTMLLERGFDGIIYPSFMSPGGTCVALWRWNAGTGPRLDVIDPEGRLPKTQASWI